MRKSDDKDVLEYPSTSDAFHRELEGFLHHAEKSTFWQVERVLKQSTYEVTELVRPLGCKVAKPVRPLGQDAVEPDGQGVALESRPFVRKCIDVRPGIGSAYEELWRAQRAGARLIGVPRIEACERDGNELRVVMEYVSGVTVASFVQAMGPGVDAVRLVIPALCEVIHGLHTRLATPLIHRDLKPSNVIMRAGAPVVIDFGCARMWNADAEADTTHFLTRCYAPPEQFGFGQTDERSDVYALGKMLYFCATGENPPNVCTAEVCIERGVPQALGEVVGACCALDPEVRPATAHEAGLMAEDALRALGIAVARAASPVGRVALGETTASSAARGRLPDGMHGELLAEMDGEPPENPVSLRETGRSTPETVRRQAPETFDYTKPATHRKGIFARLPLWVGKTWNALVCAAYSVGVVGSIMAIVQPNVRDALLPFWFRLLEYTVFGGIGIGAVCYLLLDRRRVYERIPALRELGVVRECVWCAVIFFASVLIPSLIGSAAGVL